MDTREILHLLTDEPWENLRSRAEETVLRTKGRHVFTRGLIEFSSNCSRNCMYCGLRHANRRASRYLLGMDEIMSAARNAKKHGADTIVLQSGEGAADAGWIAEITREMTSVLDLPVTLSVGECTARDYELWKRAGAARYLLRHETSDPALYAKLHKGHTLANRISCLKILKELGYETGGGFIVGLPGQTLEILAQDLALSRDLGLDMCGIGPFIPQQNTPLANAGPGNVELALRIVAVMRLLLPNANLPATTALASLDPASGQTRGLKAGANVLMPSFTPPDYATAYKIYDNKNHVAVRDAISAIETAGRIHGLHE